MSSIAAVRTELHSKANPEKAVFFPRFFKAGKGEYAEGDQFLGVTVPNQRAIAKKYCTDLSLEQVSKLLKSPWHEERLTALFMLVLQFQKGGEQTKQKIFKSYLANTKWINNWDLVDSSASYIIGEWLKDKDRRILYKLVKSKDLWEKRIAMLAAGNFIRYGEFDDTLAIAERLLGDKHDLIHKAVGWMLREVGKRDRDVLTKFLDKHAAHMSRTTLRYSIERFDEPSRKHYLNMR